jgi:threonine/homoserine/homoserine lactone efflux protein
VTFPFAFMIGFSVASIPGPTGVLIATQTLRHGAGAGLVTMTAPLALDVFVMMPLGLFLQTSLFTGSGAVVLGLGGAAFLLWLGVESIRAGIKHVNTIRAPGAAPADSKRELSPFLKGLVTHVTSPYPYLYWSTVGGSFILQGFADGGIAGASLFPVGFWVGTTSFTLILIYLVAHGKRLLPPRVEPYFHHISGALLIGSGIYLGFAVWHGLF